MKPIHIAIICWGTEYTQMMLDFLWPSLLAKENLPEWPYLKQTSLQIYCRIEDREQCFTSRVFTEMADLIPIEFTEIELEFQDNYLQSAHIQVQVVEHAIEQQAALIFLSPDSLFSNNSFKTLASLIDDEKELVLVPGPKINLDGINQVIKKHQPHQPLVLNSKQAIALWQKNCHQMTGNQFWTSRIYNHWPSIVFQTTKENISIRCFHIHPLYIKSPTSLSASSTIDGNYLSNYIESNYIVIQDDSIIALGINKVGDIDKRFIQDVEPYKRLILIDLFRQKYLQPIHREFFSREIVWPSFEAFPFEEINMQFFPLKILEIYWRIEDELMKSNSEQILLLLAELEHYFDSPKVSGQLLLWEYLLENLFFISQNSQFSKTLAQKIVANRSAIALWSD